MLRLCLAIALSAGCSAPALLPDLAVAEEHERAGRYPQALAAYERAMESCRGIEAGRRRAETCRDAHLRRAELLVTLGREEEAARAFEAIPEALPEDRIASARATYRAARLRLDLGEERRAYELLWRTVTRYPGQAFAGDALKVLLRDGRRRAPAKLYQELRRLVPTLGDTEVADNLLYAMADLAEKELERGELSRSLYDRLAEDYPGSGLYDDALWHGARLSRELGDGEGAARRLRRLLDTREVAIGAGSYFSVWLDDAQLELGRVLREDLGDAPAAARAFRRLPEDYPDSILHDDALYERAVTWAGAERPERACKVLARLKKEHPDSKYELERAPALRESLDCADHAL